ALVDVQMPGTDGLAATEAITAEFPETAVVILTTFGEDAYIARALGGGARGFVLKTGDPHDLIAGLRGVAEGAAYLSPEVARPGPRPAGCPGGAGLPGAPPAGPPRWPGGSSPSCAAPEPGAAGAAGRPPGSGGGRCRPPSARCWPWAAKGCPAARSPTGWASP